MLQVKIKEGFKMAVGCLSQASQKIFKASSDFFPD